MTHLKVIGNAHEAAAKLKTNRPLTLGQIVSCGSEEAMKTLAAQNPNLFELVVNKPPTMPDSNKMLKKSKKTKAK